jgi:hypothetical protein
VSRVRHPIHGRWPKVAAAAAPVSSAAWYAARGRLNADARWRWAALPVLLWHQVEEWVWPGGFMEWLNRDVLGSPSDLAPLTPARAAVVNVRLGWGMSLATSTLADRLPGIAIFTSASNAANAAMHLAWAGRHRRWDPGAVTAAVLLLPWSIMGLRKRVGPHGAPLGHQVVGLAAGAGGFIGLVASLRRERRVPQSRPRRARPRSRRS